MDIRQMRYFISIAKEGQVTRAAKKLNMEQPPLSRQLKLMEQELGVTLFERNGKEMKLTESGMILQEKAAEILHQINEMITEIKEVNDGVRGSLSIGSVFSCISLLPEKIAEFHNHFPLVTFKILEGDHYTLSEHLDNRTIELVITRLPFESNYNNNNYSIVELPADPFILVMPEKWSREIPGNTIQMKEISDIPLLALKSDKTIVLNKKIINECRRFGFEPNIICECSSVAIIIALVGSGIGATILPKSVMDSFPIPEIKQLEISDTSFESDVGILWLKDRYLSNSARAFIDTFLY
ncbi:LysR family transcriptional regulator [Alkalihalobacterium alkalinitrilicum]|uniref:LysR family transcriptional regulator n=1 Tax=Alkalihalobacterium alkalinitrilicum TaxID=427920 RepID=UPI000995C505|nr:LysR family transcriptional regulator [Alkalihalobacterium alkalinitrilicum]